MLYLPLLPGYGPAAKVRSLVAALSHAHRLSPMYQVGEDGYTGSSFIPSCSPKHGCSNDRYIARNPTSSLPANRCMHELEESKVKGEERKRQATCKHACARAGSHIETSPCQYARTSVAMMRPRSCFFAYGVVGMHSLVYHRIQHLDDIPIYFIVIPLNTCFPQWDGIQGGMYLLGRSECHWLENLGCSGGRDLVVRAKEGKVHRIRQRDNGLTCL